VRSLNVYLFSQNLEFNGTVPFYLAIWWISIIRRSQTMEPTC